MSTLKTLPLIALLALAGPAIAQDTSTATAAEEEAPSTAEQSEEAPETGAADGLSLGEEVTEGPQPGDTYTLSQHDDWQVRCVKMQDDQADPCQLYQLLLDDQGNTVAEVNLFGVEGAGEIQAGANIVTPLETLLTEQLRLRVDSSAPRRYPFTFCAPIGCIARVGLTGEDIAAFKRGNQATVTIVPVGAVNQQVDLTMSLTGFTAGFEAVVKANEGQQVLQ